VCIGDSPIGWTEIRPVASVHPRIGVIATAAKSASQVAS
jgi:hypothetical protein